MKKNADFVNQLIEAASLLAKGRMAILGEGNISGSLDQDRFLIKASGTSLATLKPEHLVKVYREPFLEAIKSDREFDDSEMEQLLLDSRYDPDSLKPSVETLFHAWLLNLPAVNVVGHCHAIAINRILCSPAKNNFASRRLFPDQIVYCGPSSVLVKYVDPGLILAREIARKVTLYIDTFGKPPRTILLENHGIISLGQHHQEMISATLMAEKAAKIFAGAFSMGGPVFMKEEDVNRIDNRMDEAYRRKIAGSQ